MRTPVRPLIASLREALVTMAAVLITLAAALTIDPEPGPAVFAMMLAISLSRSQLERDVRGRLEAGIVLPLVAVAGAGIGDLLVAVPWMGAVLFTGGVGASVYLRRFGELGRRVGGVIALPFTVLLVAPVHGARLGPAGSLLATVAIGLTAWASVTLLQLAAMRIGVLPTPSGRLRGDGARPAWPLRRDRAAPAAAAAPARRAGWDAATRLAVQMVVAVGGAFAVGFVVFPDRWSWIVLTGLLVTLGNAGRADVTYKALQRVVGAGAGSVLALVPLLLPHPPAWLGIALVLLALFAGLVLRPFGYVWWTLTVTVALALVQSFGAARFSLLERWEEIVVGAALALLVAWLLLPVRSEATVRRRLADALRATSDWLDDAVAAADPAASPVSEAWGRRADARAALARLERVAPPFDAARRWLPARWRPRACGWVHSGRTAVTLLLEHPREEARGPLGAARRALRAPDDLQRALDRLVAAAQRPDDVAPPP